MGGKNKGYILLQRSLLDHWIWDDASKFNYRDAFIDLIFMMNHTDAKILVNHNYITVRRGQHYTSLRKLAARWHWSKDAVRHYLDLLESDGMCHREKTGNGTLITLVNYDKNQSWKDTRKDTNQDTESYSDQDTDQDTEPTQTKNYIKNYIKNEKRMNKKSSAQKSFPSGGDRVWQ